MTQLNPITYSTRRFIAQRTYKGGIPWGPATHTGSWSLLDPATNMAWHNFSTQKIAEFIAFENKLSLLIKQNDPRAFYGDTIKKNTTIFTAMRYYMPFTRKAWMDPHLRSGA